MLFTNNQEKHIIDTIQQVEKFTTGEIRVYVDMLLQGDPLAEAQRLFYKLEMQKTKNKNGVLIYVSENEKKVAVIGDENIHRYVNQSFWNNLIEEILYSFKNKQFDIGILTAIKKIGEQLIKYFPSTPENFGINQIPNEIIYNK
ncbi:hypothetical protein ETU10_10350 [Apibacter muscae]|uniref:TPM domain-containing protein n=1 Tax=Apibacter muscae TaxID=2509004 RepID=UPI0011AD3837|nr:TPM domain-containing protein [Apibacter muscae]TWP22982.1 hypothetical protein ETU10_10350 [Apibacter muscae]